MAVTVRAPALPNLPWRDRPAGSADAVWRHDANPIVGPRPHPNILSVCNSGVIPWRDGFVGVFRADVKSALPQLHVAHSPDGRAWTFEPDPIALAPTPDDAPGTAEYAYDPRVTRIGGEYYIQWCNGYHGPTIGLARTKDFRTFEQLENAFLPYNRNGILFPRRVNGRFAMLSRPSDTGHTPFGDIYYSESPDLEFWGRHRWVMGPAREWWQGTKVGPGPSPIETSEGWLAFYHGVMSSCNGFLYSMGAVLLDLEKPWKVLRRTRKERLLAPEAPYERTGIVSNVIFPTAALVDGPTGRIAVYYGAADAHMALAYTTADAVLAALDGA